MDHRDAPGPQTAETIGVMIDIARTTTIARTTIAGCDLHSHRQKGGNPNSAFH
jgi:hypothetical protein